MEQSPYWEVAQLVNISQTHMELIGSSSYSQGPTTILSQTILVYNLTTRSLKTLLILSWHLCLYLQSGLFLSAFPNKVIYAFLICPILATCPTNHTLLDLLT
jgi:hypothetical protein